MSPLYRPKAHRLRVKIEGRAIRDAKSKKLLRKLAGSKATKVVMVAGDVAPYETGLMGFFIDGRGTRSRSPQQRDPTGGQLQYRPSTLRVVVGSEWLRIHQPEVFAAQMAARLLNNAEPRKHRRQSNGTH